MQLVQADHRVMSSPALPAASFDQRAVAHPDPFGFMPLKPTKPKENSRKQGNTMLFERA